MLTVVLRRPTRWAVVAAASLCFFGLGALAAAALARWAARLAPVEADERWESPYGPGLPVTAAPADGGGREQASPPYSGGIMAEAING